MADIQSSGPCASQKVCGRGGFRPGSGRPKKDGSDAQRRAREKAERAALPRVSPEPRVPPTIITNCQHCSNSFEYVQVGKPRKFCSDRCRFEARRPERRPRPVKVVVARPSRYQAPRAICPGCGNEFAQRMCGGQRLKTCSRECCERVQRWDWEDQSAGRIRLGPVHVRHWVFRCGQCSKVVLSDVRRTYCEACTGAQSAEEKVAARAKLAVGACVDCGGSFHRSVPDRGHPVKRCEPCREARSKASSKRAAKKAKRTASGRKRRRIAKAQRRAKERAVTADRIDPLIVFQRDRWHCRLCGIATPKALRGTYNPNAPELDHIVPLARGGAHVWENVQCSCRKCNGAKGDTVKGQLGLALK